MSTLQLNLPETRQRTVLGEKEVFLLAHPVEKACGHIEHDVNYLKEVNTDNTSLKTEAGRFFA